MASIVLEYASIEAPVTVYSFTFREFSGEDMPRTINSQAVFSSSANGANIIGGPAYRQRSIWSISAPMARTEAEDLLAMFNAWDADRAAGHSSVVGVVDTTFGPAVSANAIFSTPPSFTWANPSLMFVDFGLSEV